jgi:hypothetical protein
VWNNWRRQLAWLKATLGVRRPSGDSVLFGAESSTVPRFRGRARRPCYGRARVAEAEQEQIVFVMAAGDRPRLYRSVAAGAGRRALETIAEAQTPWIEVDDDYWVNRDHVLYAYVTKAGEESWHAV